MATTISGDNGIDKVANGTVDLTTDVTGILPQTQGGTGASSLPSGVTSLNGQTGAITNTDLYAIGSYVTGRPQNTTNYAVNSTIAGSILYTTTLSNVYWNGAWVAYAGQAVATLVNTGTWRCITGTGAAVTGAIAIGLWVRIS